jgi:hypothetical protein
MQDPESPERTNAANLTAPDPDRAELPSPDRRERTQTNAACGVQTS